MDLTDKLKTSQYPLPPHLVPPGVISSQLHDPVAAADLRRSCCCSWGHRGPRTDTMHEVPLLQLQICSTNLPPICFQWQYHRCIS